VVIRVRFPVGLPQCHSARGCASSPRAIQIEQRHEPHGSVPAKDMFYYVYILRNESGRLYIGYSEDVERRVADHNAGKVFATKPYIPYKLIFYEAYTSMVDAKRREMYLKTTKGRTTIKTMLSETLK